MPGLKIICCFGSGHKEGFVWAERRIRKCLACPFPRYRDTKFGCMRPRRSAGQATRASSTRAATTSPRRTTRPAPPCGSRSAEPEFFSKSKIRQHHRRQNDVLPPVFYCRRAAVQRPIVGDLIIGPLQKGAAGTALCRR